MKKYSTEKDYIKAVRKASREDEIEAYGHPIAYRNVRQSKKAYNRKKEKVTHRGPTGLSQDTFD